MNFSHSLLSDANVRKKADQASIDRWEIWKNSCNKKRKQRKPTYSFNVEFIHSNSYKETKL